MVFLLPTLLSTLMICVLAAATDARPDLMVIMNLELRYWLQLRWRLEVSQRRIAAAAETSMEQRNSMKRKQLLTEESLGSQSKRIKKAQTTWRVQLVCIPLTSHTFLHDSEVKRMQY